MEDEFTVTSYRHMHLIKLSTSRTTDSHKMMKLVFSQIVHQISILFYFDVFKLFLCNMAENAARKPRSFQGAI